MSRRRGPARCMHCGVPVAFFASPFTRKTRTFEVKPVDPRTHQGPPAYPVESRTAWRFHELAADLQVRRGCSTEDAEAEVYDMPWHVPHSCTNAPTHDDPGDARP